MNRARVALGATFVATMLTAGAALAQQAPPMTQVLAGKKFTPPIKGEALVEFTPPVTKNEKGVVVTRITVRNAALAPIPRLTIAETWYDTAGNIVTGGKGSVNGLLQPGEVQTITISTPYNAKMKSNNYNFSHANGTVKPQKVAKIEAPETAGAADAPAADAKK
ncbi:MAG: hypothetical protein AB7I13_03260 [Vicinamibacterales bacterium]